MTQGEDAFRGTERFTIVRRIGAGGMGVVYEAFDRERNERVALKTLREFDAVALYRFKQEFRNLSEILHSRLVPLYELVGDGDRWFFTMELVEHGTDLLTFVRGGGPAARPSHTSTSAPTMGAVPVVTDSEDLDQDAAAAGSIPAERDALPCAAIDVDRLRAVFRQLAEGVNALHAADRLHRDLKPSNVLVTADGRVVILDFGLVATLSDAAPTLDRADRQSPGGSRQVYQSTDRALMGTWSFMSPEQAARAPLTPASDWYAVGVMLFQALTGRLPIEGSGPEVLARKQLADGPAPSQLVSGIPEDLDRLTAALMRRNPADRPEAGEILSVLGTEVDSASATPAMPDLFVGREAHLRELTQCFRTMQRGRTVICHVSGGSGAGKSTLVSKFLDAIAASDGALALRGRCYEQESVPYKALDSLVDALARHLETMDEREVDRIVPPHAADLCRVFPVLARVAAFARGERQSAGAGDLREVRRHASEALRALLVGLSHRVPLVLCIDDLQWGDLDSAALITELVRPPEAPRLLLLLSYRSEYFERSPCLRSLREVSVVEGPDRLSRRVDVDALPPSDTRALAEALLAGRMDAAAGRDAIEWVVTESGGRPFFVYELVAHLQSGAALDTRPDLDSVLWDRVTRLPDAARRLLEVIAVAGRPVQLRDAQTAALLPALTPDVVAGLRAARLVRTTGRTLHDMIETFHDRIRESVVVRLPPGARRHHYASLASTLEAGGHADAETLAAYLEGAGEAERASRGYERAAADAIQVLAFERAEDLLKRAVGLAIQPPDRARIHERMIHFYTDMARFADAYATGRAAVGAYGVRLPASFVPPLFLLDFAAARLRLRGRSTADLLALPTTTDERLVTAIRLMSAVAKAAYQVRPELCVAVATKIVNLCLRHGNTPDCAIGYMVFGAIFHGGVLRRHRFGYDFGRLALALVDRYANEQQRAEVNFVVGYFGTSWLRPATEAEALWAVAHEAGLRSGDLFHTGCACAGTTMSRFMRGVPLPEIWTGTEPMLDLLRRNRLREPLGVVTAIRQAIRNLRGKTSSAATFDGEGFDEQVFVRDLAGYGSRHFAHMYFIIRMQVAYLRGDYEAAIELGTRSATYLKESPGMLHIADHYFYQALAHAAAGRSPRLVARAVRRFRTWTAGCPDNFQAKLQVLEGEVARTAGRHAEAAALHAQASEAARRYGYTHVEALAEDLRSRALAAAGCGDESDAACVRSMEAYRRWGATSLGGPARPAAR